MARGYDIVDETGLQENSEGDPILPIQCRMARTALSWGVRDLAKRAKVSPDTVSRLERGEKLHFRTMEAIRTAFERGGVEFIPENGGGAGVRLKKPGPQNP